MELSLQTVGQVDSPEELARKIHRLVVSRPAPYAEWSTTDDRPRPLGPPLHFTPPPLTVDVVQKHLSGEKSIFHYPFGLDGRTVTASIRIRLLKNAALPLVVDETGTEFSQFIGGSPWVQWYERTRAALPLRKYIKIQFRTALARLIKDVPPNQYYVTYDGEPYVTLHLRPGRKMNALPAYDLAVKCVTSAGFRAFADIGGLDVFAGAKLADDIKLATDPQWAAADQGFSTGAVFLDILAPRPDYFDDISLFEKNDRKSLAALPVIPLPLGKSARRPGEPVFFVETDLAKSPLTELVPADASAVVNSVLREESR